MKLRRFRRRFWRNAARAPHPLPIGAIRWHTTTRANHVSINSLSLCSLCLCGSSRFLGSWGHPLLQRPHFHVVYEHFLPVLAAGAEHEAGFFNMEIFGGCAERLLAIDSRHDVVSLHFE